MRSRAPRISDSSAPVSPAIAPPCCALCFFFFIITTGYLLAYAEHRPGIYLLMRVIEDTIADPQLNVLDFGPGRSEYMQRFSNDGYEEQHLLLFAPRTRPQVARITSTAVRGASVGARRVLDHVGVTQKVKTTWRRR